MPVSSRTPCAIWASATDGKTEIRTSSLVCIAPSQVPLRRADEHQPPAEIVITFASDEPNVNRLRDVAWQRQRVRQVTFRRRELLRVFVRWKGQRQYRLVATDGDPIQRV